MQTERDNKILELSTQGLSQAAIARQVGCGQTTVGRVLNPAIRERGRNRSREYMRDRLANDPAFRARTREYNVAYQRERQDTDFSYRIQQALHGIRHKSGKHGYAPCTSTWQECLSYYTGECHACGVSEERCKTRLELDHDHATGKFRGWLCRGCNAHVERSNAEHLVSYLDNYKSPRGGQQ